MRRLLILLWLVATTITCHAQDLLVTASGDSINCQVVKVALDSVQFSFVRGSKEYMALIPFDRVAKIDRGYYTWLDSINSSATNTYYELYIEPISFSASASFGIGYAAGETGAKVSNVVSKKLKMGIVYSANAVYYFAHHGICVSMIQYASLCKSCKLRKNFMGIGYSYRDYINTDTKRFLWFADAYVGVANLKINNTRGTYSEEITGSNVGFSANVGFETKVFWRFNVGGKINATTAYLSKIEKSYADNNKFYFPETKELGKNNRINLSHFDLCAFIRFEL